MCDSPHTVSLLQVRAQLEEKENRKFSTFKAIEYKTQVVAGRNLFIKASPGVAAGSAHVYPCVCVRVCCV